MGNTVNNLPVVWNKPYALDDVIELMKRVDVESRPDLRFLHLEIDTKDGKFLIRDDQDQIRSLETLQNELGPPEISRPATRVLESVPRTQILATDGEFEDEPRHVLRIGRPSLERDDATPSREMAKRRYNNRLIVRPTEMCGRIRKGTKEFIVRSGSFLPKDIILVKENGIIRPAKSDLMISDHRFIRDEKLDWWSRQVEMYSAQIDCDEFEEINRRTREGKWFTEPGKVIQGFIHQDLDNHNMWRLSIVTVEANAIVAPTHHRMPKMVEAWALIAA